MSVHEIVVLVVVVLAILAIVILVLAPWRSVQRDALDDEAYYALLAGEDPPEADSGPADQSDDDEAGPSAGDISIP